MVRRMGEDPYERALAMRTAERLAELHPQLARWEPSRVTGAVLGLVDDPWHLHDAAAHLRARGVVVESVDRPEEVAPMLQGSPVRQCWWLPHERVADAHALVSGFREGLVEAGSSLRCGVQVEELLVEGGRAVGVRTAAGEVRGDAVVLAAGAWSGMLAARAEVHRPLFPLRRTLLQTEAHALSAEHPWTWIDDVGVYARPEAGGFLLSGCDEAIDEPTDRPSTGPVEAEHRALALDKVERYLPALGPLRFRNGWSGLRTFAPDRRPVLGDEPCMPGLWWAAGLGGYGVTCSLAVGEAVAGWMLGDAVPWLDRAAVSPARSHMRRWAIRPTGDIAGGRLVRVPAAR